MELMTESQTAKSWQNDMKGFTQSPKKKTQLIKHEGNKLIS